MRAEEPDIERMGSRSTLHMAQFQTEVGKMFAKSNWVLRAHREGGTQGATQEQYISSPIVTKVELCKCFGSINHSK